MITETKEVYEFKGYFGTKSYCRIDIAVDPHDPNDRSDETIYVCATDLGRGTSVTNAAESLWQQVKKDFKHVIEYNGFSLKNVVSLERYPDNDYVDQVLFDADGKVSWKRFDQADFDRLFWGIHD